jgi:hypothetical protein
MACGHIAGVTCIECAAAQIGDFARRSGYDEAYLRQQIAAITAERDANEQRALHAEEQVAKLLARLERAEAVCRAVDAVLYSPTVDTGKAWHDALDAWRAGRGDA